jgi:hypothetical protein
MDAAHHIREGEREREREEERGEGGQKRLPHATLQISIWLVR